MKKFGIPILVGLVIGGVASAGYLWWIRSRPAPAQQVTLPTPTPVQLLTWTDPNGFTFQYPEELLINKHDEDKENYAHLEFTHPDHSGKLIVWGKDPAKGVTDAASWVKNEKRFTGASTLDTQLGGQVAKKVMVIGITRMLVTGAVYDNIVWSVETTLEDADFWTGVHNTIADSFAFVPVKESTPVVDDVVVDEEEVVE